VTDAPAQERLAACRASWVSAQRLGRTLVALRMLNAHGHELLERSVLPQIDAALADLDEGLEPDQLSAVNEFVPQALEALAEVSTDPCLPAMRDDFAAGLAALRR
jgi:hypothetical protein